MAEIGRLIIETAFTQDVPADAVDQQLIRRDHGSFVAGYHVESAQALGSYLGSSLEGGDRVVVLNLRKGVLGNV